MGVELVKSGEETLHPHYLLVFNRLKQVDVECRVFPDISAFKMLLFSPVGFEIRQNKATIAIDTLDNCQRHTSKLQT